MSSSYELHFPKYIFVTFDPEKQIGGWIDSNLFCQVNAEKLKMIWLKMIFLFQLLDDIKIESIQMHSGWFLFNFIGRLTQFTR